MPNCPTCTHWTVERRNLYEDGSAVTTFIAPEGLGACDVLNQNTPRDFGCLKHEDGGIGLVVTRKTGVPSDHWEMVACPDCEGRGSTDSYNCNRCAGTAKIRRYDDGYLADATWDHPHEKERKRLVAAAKRREQLEAELRGMDPPLEEIDGTKLQPREPARSGVAAWTSDGITGGTSSA